MQSLQDLIYDVKLTFSGIVHLENNSGWEGSNVRVAHSVIISKHVENSSESPIDGLFGIAFSNNPNFCYMHIFLALLSHDKLLFYSKKHFVAPFLDARLLFQIHMEEY